MERGFQVTPKHTLPLLMAVVAALLVGCDGGGGSTAVSGTDDGSGSEKRLVVGFSQIGAENSWRTANTQSIRDEAEKRGIDLRFADAQLKQENQIKALRTFIQLGVDVIAFSPVVKTGWEPVLREIKAAGIPVVLSDRRVEVSDPDLYVTFVGADFIAEGSKAARWLAEYTGGKANIAELQGEPGSDPAIERKQGFDQVIAEYPDMKIIKSQTGNFQRSKGKEVMEAFLKSPEGNDITAVYAHNDDMALGAIQAIEEAGKNPGVDIIIVSIDGVKGAFEAMVAGKLNCTVECNALLGPLLFDTIEKVLAGEQLPKHVVVQEDVFDQSVAKDVIDSRKY